MNLPPLRFIFLGAFLLLTRSSVTAQVAAEPAAPAAPSAVAQTSKWEKEVAAYEAADRENPPAKGGIVFIGSSSIRLWKSLARDFPDQPVLNRGFGGSQIADATGLVDRLVVPHEPRLVVLYSGGNDLNAGKSAEQVFAAFKEFVATVQARLPHTEIAYISIAGNPARWKQVEKVKAANALIEEFTKQSPRLKFINVFPHMLGPDGLPKPEIFSSDQLHMNEDGYKLWTEIVRPFLAK